jgi:hypothetical protein
MKYYPGETVAGMSQDETQAQQQLRGNLGTVQNIADQGNTALQFQLGKSLDPSTNPYFAQYAKAATNPLYEQLNEQVMPGLRSDAFASGMYGTNRQGIAEGLAAKGTARAAGDVTSKMYSDLYATGMQQQGNAIQMAPTVQAMQTAAPSLQAGIGAQDRAYQQSLIDEAMQRYNYNQMAPWAKLGAYQQLVTGQYGGQTTATGAGGGAGGGSPWMGAAGGAMSGAATGAQVGSMFGPGYGTLIGAGAGAVLGGAGGYFGSR